MQPKPVAETSRLLFQSLRLFITYDGGSCANCSRDPACLSRSRGKVLRGAGDDATQQGTSRSAIPSAMLRHVFREILKTDWSQARAISSLPCTVAIAVALIAGLAAGKPMAGMVAASGAMSVGFGAFQRLGRSRVMPMFWASIGMTVCTGVGSLATQSPVALGVNAAVVGLFYGLLTAVSGGTAWISLQCAIFAVVSTGYPATPAAVM